MQLTKKIAGKKERLAELAESLSSQFEPGTCQKYLEDSFHAFFTSFHMEGLSMKERDKVLSIYLSIRDFFDNLDGLSVEN